MFGMGSITQKRQSYKKSFVLLRYLYKHNLTSLYMSVPVQDYW